MRMLRDSPWAFSSSPEEDSARDPALIAARLADPEQAILAVEEGGTGELIASTGVFRKTQAKSRHRAAVVAVFVDPAHRGLGLGRASVGFRAWGREPESLEIDGRRYDEIFMALRLHPESGR